MIIRLQCETLSRRGVGQLLDRMADVRASTNGGLRVLGVGATMFNRRPRLARTVLAEIGDDRSRFADARALKAYAGAAPVTRAGGKSLTVMHRRFKNQRLAGVGYLWAFSALAAVNAEATAATTSVAIRKRGDFLGFT